MVCLHTASLHPPKAWELAGALLLALRGRSKPISGALNRNVTFVLWSYAGLKPKLFGDGGKKEYGAVVSVLPAGTRDRKGT